MKKNNRIEFLFTIIVIVLPLFYSMLMYHRLPEQMAVHFNLSHRADTYIDKGIFIFLFPVFILLFQVFVYWMSRYKKILNQNFEHLLLWLFPFVHLILYPAILYRNLDRTFDLPQTVLVLLGLIMMMIGNYLPKKIQADRNPAPHQLAYVMVFLGFCLLIWGLFF